METLQNWNKIADIPEKLNTHVSSLGNDGLLWTLATYIPKNKSAIFLPSSHKKTGLEEGNKAILTVLESTVLWSKLIK